MASITRVRLPILIRSSPALTRPISCTATLRKGPVETTKDTLKKADRLVSDVAVKGIEVGEEATQKAKDTLGIKGSEVKGKSQELKGDAEELAGRGKGKAEEAIGKAKGKAHEVSGKMGV
ncbi:hypothetical protein ASPZODRAFT_138649 [Penicilliopsis zonata CBS 506.65]|uniref:CsbD-like domain-containing protein n=1 Tax=Penicilliopsis zonata CBS 506.65 TaxID=1073090 RepID=A0A1L9SWR8_9EURO|nr:hypothetical protein ASPZODRAFT_138649 [Penicilliopsis zonata CBS 506.65]OJJ51567.1 hypothetical protein ASPZODRAFT_138649 [Penicilliopsis zonata CBS 506.65]